MMRFGERWTRPKYANDKKKEEEEKMYNIMLKGKDKIIK